MEGEGAHGLVRDSANAERRFHLLYHAHNKKREQTTRVNLPGAPPTSQRPSHQVELRPAGRQPPGRLDINWPVQAQLKLPSTLAMVCMIWWRWSRF